MKSLARTILIYVTVASPLWSQVPQKPPLTRYSSLWLVSPFTSKPEPQALATRANPLEDFTLTGIAPVPGGYRITIVSKKNREVKKVIEPGRDSEFQVVSVDRNPGVSLGTTVTLTDGRVRGTVRFERDKITLNAPPAAPDNIAKEVAPGQQTASEKTNVARQPRARIVPSATPKKRDASNPNR